MKPIENLLQQQRELYQSLEIKNDITMPEATYIPFNDAYKVYALEGIIDNAKDVFGPYGGIYMNLYTSPTTKQTVLSKSSDGHKYFQNLNFLQVPTESLLAVIRERTLYVSGSNGKTSRDGTTSLAMIAATVSSDLLLNRLKNPGEFIVPSSIIKATLETISVEFRKLVDAKKELIYDEDNCSYVEGGFDAAVNAISTTVDRNPIIVDAYRRLMISCMEKGINIAESTKPNFPERVIDGQPGFDLRLDSGLKVFASSLEKTKASAFRESTAPIFFLDGFMGDHNAAPFIPKIKKFIVELLNTIDPDNGFYMFSKHNPNGIEPPIFFYNRSPECLKKLFEEIRDYVSVTIKDPSTGQVFSETISPRFIFLESEDTSKESYTDLLDIFNESVIGLDGYRRLISDSARKFLNESTFEAQSGVPFENEISKVKLPNIFELNAAGDMSIKRIKYNQSIIDDLKLDSVTGEETVTVNIKDTLATCTFDGGNMFIRPVKDLHKQRIQIKKDKLMDDLKNYSKSTSEYEVVKGNLNMYSTATLTPIITTKTEDEYEFMYDVYQDAQGIFESVHVHGVMGGGNTTLFKVMDDLIAKVNFELDVIYGDMIVKKGLNQAVKDKYMEFANKVLDSIIRGYTRTYKILLRADEKSIIDIIDSYRTIYKEDSTTTFNIIFGNFDKGTLESTRTTVDTFQAALDVMLDLLSTKRIRVQKEAETVTMSRDFSSSGSIYVAKSMNDYYNSK